VTPACLLKEDSVLVHGRSKDYLERASSVGNNTVCVIFFVGEFGFFWIGFCQVKTGCHLYRLSIYLQACYCVH
jgi:hypothetical protein